MKKIYLLRHGETDWNKECRYQGHADIPLNEQGRQQGAQLFQRLKDESIDVVYSSDLRRASEFASIIFPSKELTIVPELREMNFGDFEGRTYHELAGDAKSPFQAWINNPTGVFVPGGESLSAMVDRVMMAFDQIRRVSAEKVAIVTHGGVIKIILGAIMGMSLEQRLLIKQNNGGLNILNVENDTMTIECMNGEKVWEP